MLPARPEHARVRKAFPQHHARGRACSYDARGTGTILPAATPELRFSVHHGTLHFMK